MSSWGSRASLHFGGSVSDLQLAGSVRMAGVLAVKAFLRASGPFGSFQPVKRTDAPLWKHAQGPCFVAGRRVLLKMQRIYLIWFILTMINKSGGNLAHYI